MFDAHHDRPVVPGADRGDRRRPSSSVEKAHARRSCRSSRAALRSSARASPTGAWPACSKTTEHEVRARRATRWACARSTSASTPAPPSSRRSTAYMYSTYDEECEAEPTDRKKIMVLGGGPNRIGQGIEFDYCCVHAALALREDGFETIMVNCNPETVSTDYDTSRPPVLRAAHARGRARDRATWRSPMGVIVQFGGQTPLKLARASRRRRADHRHHRPTSIDLAEDRERFQQLLHELGLQPAAEPHRAHRGRRRSSRRERDRLSAGGAAELRARRPRDGDRARRRATSSATCARRSRCRNDSPVLLDRFLDDAIEVDVDCISDGERRDDRRHHGAHRAGGRALRRLGLLAAAVLAVGRSCRTSCAARPSRWRKALNVVGPDERAVRDPGRGRQRRVYVLEVNPRASRTVPFVPRRPAMPLAKIAARCMVGQDARPAQGVTERGRSRRTSRSRKRSSRSSSSRRRHRSSARRCVRPAR